MTKEQLADIEARSGAAANDVMLLLAALRKAEGEVVRLHNDASTEEYVLPAALAEIERQQNENARLRKALKYYGNEQAYEENLDFEGYSKGLKDRGLIMDSGAIARTALEATE